MSRYYLANKRRRWGKVMNLDIHKFVKEVYELEKIEKNDNYKEIKDFLILINNNQDEIKKISMERLVHLFNQMEECLENKDIEELFYGCDLNKYKKMPMIRPQQKRRII